MLLTVEDVVLLIEEVLEGCIDEGAVLLVSPNEFATLLTEKLEEEGFLDQAGLRSDLDDDF